MIEAIKNISFLEWSIIAGSFFVVIVTIIIFWQSRTSKDDFDVRLVVTEIFMATLLATLIVEMFSTGSLTDFAIKTVVIVAVVPAGFFLVRSVRNEVASRRKIESLLKELSEINEQLKILDLKKSEFMSFVAHHLREPLTFIKGTTSMLLEGSFGPLTETAKGAMERIFESSERLIVIINEFLNITRIESGEMSYQFSKSDLRVILTEIVVDMQLNARNAGLDMELHIEDDGTALNTYDTEEYNPRFTAIIDQGKIRQVLLNLIDNAIKYTPSGRVDIYLSTDEKEKKIRVRVTDTGIGMDNETLAKIFNKFSRAEGVSKVYTEGSGLGLYVAHEIMKKHTGRIFAESVGHGKGSSFIVEFFK